MNKIARKIFLLLSTLSVFNFFFKKITTLDIFDYAEELLLLFSFAILLQGIWSRRKLALMHIAVFVFLSYSIIISLVFGLNKSFIEITLQSIISIKFFIFLMTFVMLFKNHIWEIRKFLFWMLAFAALGVALHLLLGEKFNAIYGVSKYARPNIRYTGFFRHPNHLAYLAVVFIALTLDTIKKKNENISLQGWLKVMIGVGVIILADTRTAILAIAILFTVFYWDYVYKNILVFFSFIFLGMLIVFGVLLFTDLPESIMANIEMSYSLQSDYIRGLMFYMSLLLIAQYFPIGSGAGTFGSIFAKDSQVYKDFGVNDRFYFVEEWGIYDSNFASILGEYGIMGILLFAYLFRHAYWHLKNNFSGSKPSPMLKAMFWVFVFFCISNPMLTNSVYIIMSIPAFLLIANTEEK
ncbi:MAG: O-antigen ligase family protein [Flavobacteriaceae bacterium]